MERIKVYDRNPRTHPQAQIDLIASSMREEGVTNPILVDEEGVIIFGHGRRLAAIQNGFAEYPVAVARGWDETKKQAVRLKDNSFAALSGWDAGLLKVELSELKLTGYDLNLLGFEEFQLRSYGISSGTESGVDPEATPEVPADPVSRTGDLWILGDHRLFCGDCTRKEDVAAALGKAVPNLLVSDPPYGVEYDANWRNERARYSPGMGNRTIGAGAVGKVNNDDRSDWKDAWALFPGDAAYVWHAGLQSGFVFHSLIAAGFDIRAQIIWAKQQFAIGRGHYHFQHEPCFYAVRRGGKSGWSSDRKQTTVWNIPKPQKSETGHSTQKPIECMKRPIQNNSKAGDAVYDPFMGSGTTIIAAEMTGRHAIGLEINPAYVDVCILRWEGFAGKAAIHAGTGQTYAEMKESRHEKPARKTRKSRINA